MKKNLCFRFQQTIKFIWRLTKLVSSKDLFSGNYIFVNRHKNLIVCWKWKQIRFFFLCL